MPLGFVTSLSNLPERGLYPGFALPPGFVNERSTEVDELPPLRPVVNNSAGISLQVDQQLGDYTLTSISGGRFVALGGGIPIEENSHVVAGFGVSGGTTEQDIEVAEAAFFRFQPHTGSASGTP